MSKPTIKNNMLHWTFPTSTSCSFWGLCHILISRCDDPGETLITTLWEQHQINRRVNGPSSKNDKYSFMACCQGVGVFVCQSRGGGGSEVNSRTMTTPKQSPLVNMSSYFCPDWRFNKKRGVDGCRWARNNETGVIKTGLQTLRSVQLKSSTHLRASNQRHDGRGRGRYAATRWVIRRDDHERWAPGPSTQTGTPR